MIRYVVGFLFDETYSHVVLIEKNRPAHFNGKHNGVGGKVELSDRRSIDAMRREFQEEAGLLVEDWTFYATSQGREFSLDIFYTTGDVHAVSTQTDEPVKVFAVNDLPVCVDDVHGLINSIVTVKTQ